jgi:DNA invertase Pin-like site-specific DNA recombinase
MTMNANATPTAYIRRSVASRADPGDVSREFQTEEVRRLAGADGPTLAIIDRDWGRSAATDKTGRRLAFLALLDAIEAGDVSALYAYSTDRLARSVEWSARLLNACRRAGVPIVTREGRIEPGDAGAALLFNVLAAVNENALSGMEAKARASIGRRQARNVEAGRAPNAGMGRKPYGPETTAAVLAAFDEAGSFLGATKALTAAGVPSYLGGKPNPRENGGTYGWNVMTVSRIVRRERPAMPKVGRQGAAPRARRLFSGLLVCGAPGCGQILSTMPRPGGRQVGYYCRKAHNDPTHPRPYVVSERFLLPWIRDEIARLRIVDPLTGEPIDAVALATTNAAQRDALAAEKARILRQNAKGYITDAELDAGMAAVAVELDRLGVAEAVVNVPPVDWTWPVPELNAYLRAIVSRVDLGPDMRPVWAEWRDRTLRAD